MINKYICIVYIYTSNISNVLFAHKGTSTPRKPQKSSARVPELLREVQMKNTMGQLDDEPDQDDVEAALEEIEHDEHISKGKQLLFFKK